MIEDTLCPRCGKRMIPRTNRAAGTKFWGCSDYPRCKGTRDSTGFSREDEYQDQDQGESRTHPRWWDLGPDNKEHKS